MSRDAKLWWGAGLVILAGSIALQLFAPKVTPPLAATSPRHQVPVEEPVNQPTDINRFATCSHIEPGEQWAACRFWRPIPKEDFDLFGVTAVTANSMEKSRKALDEETMMMGVMERSFRWMLLAAVSALVAVVIAVLGVAYLVMRWFTAGSR